MGTFIIAALIGIWFITVCYHKIKKIKEGRFGCCGCDKCTSHCGGKKDQ